MEYLVFRLYGPLASWGQAAVGGDRPTGLYPTRSALIGLLAAGLGIKRDEEELMTQLNNSVQLSVKQLVPSSLMRDYHTSQVPSTNRKVNHLTRKSELNEKKLNTVLSSRDYRCDGLWVIAVNLTQTSHFKLEQLQNGLKKPVFTLYLGRKSCPLALPVMPKIVTTDTLKQALDTDFPTITRTEKEDKMWLRANHWATYYWEGSKTAFGEQTVITTHPWDNPINKLRWQFNQRTLHQVSMQEGV